MNEKQNFLNKCGELLYEYIDPFEVPGALKAIKEALPVFERKGKWIVYENSVFEKRYKCSSCKRFTFHNGEMLKKYKFCPNCGAKMEGANNET